MLQENNLPPTWIKGFHYTHYEGKLQYNALGQTGMIVSKLGFGGSVIGGVFSAINEQESIEVVREAIKRGINYIDTAPWYGNGKAEIILGKALEGLPRNSYYVATKVGRYKPHVKEMFDFSAKKTFQSIDESLTRLKLDYVDILQVHDLEFAPNLDIIINETLPALEKIKESGKAKFIGITGYPLTTLKEIVKRSPIKIDTVLSYCRCCLFDTSLLNYIDFFEKEKFGIINASALAMGLLTDAGPPQWHPAPVEIKEACVAAAKFCKEKNVDIAKLGLSYAMSQSGPNTHLIGSAELKTLDQNLDVAINGLNDLEQSVLNDIIIKFFEPLTVVHWENIEVEKYWKQLKKANSV